MKLILVFLATYYVQSYASTDWPTNLKTFSHAIKAAYCYANQEIEVFNYATGPGVITEQWYTGYECFGPKTIIRYYIDDNSKPYFEVNLYMAHGIGFVSASSDSNQTVESNMAASDKEDGAGYKTKVNGPDDPGIPWGTKRIGHTAKGGGLYNTIRVPFQKSIRITFESPSNGYYWYIVRGAENYPIKIGDLVLPKSAMLKLYKKENYVMQPKEYIVVASTANKTGLLYKVTLAATSSDFNYLEACYRALIDDADDFQFLSSGTEDFFLSAYYYSGGLFHTDHAGLTFLQNPGTMSAYKFFEDDPVFFQKSFKLIWRCGEVNDNDCYKPGGGCFISGNNQYCNTKHGILKHRMPQLDNNVQLAITTMSSYVWTYEW